MTCGLKKMNWDVERISKEAANSRLAPVPVPRNIFGFFLNKLQDSGLIKN